MMYMGIDQSLTATGVCVMNEKKKILFTTTIETTKELSDSERCAFIAECLIKKAKAFNVDIAGIENYAFSVRGNYSFRAGELGGTIKYLFRKNKIPLKFVQISRHKKMFTGNGRADKKVMLEVAQTKYGAIDNHNEADAVSIAEFLVKDK